jgi:general secretion pathway protein G
MNKCLTQPPLCRGFTLIELLVVLALIAILAAIVTPQYFDRVNDARETVLKQNLIETRKIIDQFYRDKQRYPLKLAELVEARYLRGIPFDPITQSTDTWILIKPENAEGVIDLRSGAIGNAKDGSPYATW